MSDPNPNPPADRTPEEIEAAVARQQAEAAKFLVDEIRGTLPGISEAS